MVLGLLVHGRLRLHGPRHLSRVRVGVGVRVRAGARARVRVRARARARASASATGAEASCVTYAAKRGSVCP